MVVCSSREIQILGQVLLRTTNPFLATPCKDSARQLRHLRLQQLNTHMHTKRPEHRRWRRISDRVHFFIVLPRSSLQWRNVWQFSCIKSVHSLERLSVVESIHANFAAISADTADLPASSLPRRMSYCCCRPLIVCFFWLRFSLAFMPRWPYSTADGKVQTNKYFYTCTRPNMLPTDPSLRPMATKTLVLKQYLYWAQYLSFEVVMCNS